MHKTEQKIIKLFKDNPYEEFSTKEIIMQITPWMKKDNFSCDFGNKEADIKQRKKIAKLHRNILYHLNKLEKNKILKVSNVGLKGQKHFKLDLNDGEELTFERNKRKVIISKPHGKALPIKGYENEGFVFRYDPDTWTTKVNSILLQSEKFNIKDLYDTIIDCFSHVNDTICLNDFECFIQENNQNELGKFFHNLFDDCSNYGKDVTLTIDVKNIKNQQPIIDFLKLVSGYKNENIHIIFEIKSEHIYDAKDFFHEVVELFMETKTKLYIKNKDLHKPPYILGKAGPYTFSENDWKNYMDYSLADSYGVLCSSCTIVVDVEKFFEKNGKINEFRNLIDNVLKALFMANSIQRNHSLEHFNGIANLNSKSPTDFFSISRNYIRFWNYGWKQPNKDQQIMLNLIESTKKEVTEFALTQESIYLACGMPTQFKTAFSCAFEGFTKKKKTVKDFKKASISSIEEIYKDKLNKPLKTKETIGKIFDGGDRARIARLGKANASDILREIDIIMNLYNIPLLCYDFGEIAEGNLKLTSFI